MFCPTERDFLYRPQQVRELSTLLRPSSHLLRGIGIGALLALANGCSEPIRTGLEAEPPPPQSQLTDPVIEAGVRFVDVGIEVGLDAANVSGTAAQRYMAESASAGCAFLDYDGDGFLDLFFVTGTRPGGAAADADATNRLYRNVPGSPASNRAFAVADLDLGPAGWGMGCTVGDVDNDGDPDVYATYLGPNRLYLNDAGQRLPEVAGGFGVADPGWGASAAFGDLDADGLLDLYITNYVEFNLSDPGRHGVDCLYKGLPVFCGPANFVRQSDKVYRNSGDGFADMSAVTGIDHHAYPGLGTVLVDFDDDGDLDIYVANDTAPNLLFRNDGDWRFEEIGLQAGVAFSGEGRDQAGMGVAAGDFDNDGRLDLFVTNFSDDVNTLYRNEGGHEIQFADVTYQVGLGGSVMPYLGWGTGFFDYDNDGWLDLYVVNGHLYPELDRYPHGLSYAQRNLIYHNRNGCFAEVQDGAGPGWSVEKVSRAASVGDYDNDGDPDLLITNLNDVPTLLRNDGGSDNHWLGLDLVGTQSNRDAIGARVNVIAGGRQLVRDVQRGHGFQAAHDKRLLFGLGEADAVERVEIRWPSGATQVVEDPPLQQYLTVTEGEGEWVAAAPAAATSSADSDYGRDGVRNRARDRVREAGPKLPPGVEGWTREDFVRNTSRLFDEGRYAEVKTILEVGLRRKPDSPHMRFLLGQVLVMGFGRYEEGAAELERAVREMPTAVDAHFYLGRAYLRLNRLHEAIGSYRRAGELVPSSWEFLHELGLAYIRADSMDAAAAALQQSVQRAPWQPGPHLQLVEVFRNLQRDDEAHEHQELFARLAPVQKEVKKLEKQSKASPREPQVRLDLAVAYRRQGRTQEALSQFNKAAELDPQNAPAYLGIGSVLYELRRFDEAVRAFEEAGRRAPELADVYDGLGRAHAARGRLAEAIRAWKTLLQKNPEHAQARRLIAEARATLQQ